MKVDVLIICYNQEQYIRQALESVLMQRVAEDVAVRIIVADDCSTDGTMAIIRELETQSPFPFVYLDNSTNLGHIANYKRSFAACSGDYVCVIEGDDYWSSPYHIEKHVRFLDEHRECAMSVNRLVEYYQDNGLFSIPANKYGELRLYNIWDQIIGNRINNHSSACYRTKLLHNVDDSIFSEYFDDWLLGIWMAQKGFIAQIPFVLSVYRVHSVGVYSGINKKEKYEEHVRRIKYADQLWGMKYHELFNIAIRNCNKYFFPRHRKRDYIPVFILKFCSYIFPKILNDKYGL